MLAQRPTAAAPEGPTDAPNPKGPAPSKAPVRPTAKDMKAVAQKLPYPAKQADMEMQPQSDLRAYRAAGR